MAVPRRRRALATLLALAALLPGAAAAAPPPPIRILVGYSPGGVGDTVARILAEPLRRELGRAVIVENRPGANGRLAAQALKAAAADGRTFLQANDGWAVFQPLLHRPAQLRYSMTADLLPVARVVSYPLALAVHRDVPAADLRGYADWLRADPRRATYGAAGAGGQLEFLGTLLGRELGTPLTLVPYKGNAPMLTDLLGGQLPAGLLVAGDALAAGERLKLLAVLSERRWPGAPGVPTLREQGYKLALGESWLGWWTRAGTPRAEVARMEAALQKVLALPEVREAIERSAHVTPAFVGGAALDRQLREDWARWAPVVRGAASSTR